MSTMPIPATPVVVIEIAGEQVKVNGELVDVEGHSSLHQAGVHAAAERVAQVLARPVRAIATDATTVTQLVVHPDGTVTDVEVLEQLAPKLLAESAGEEISETSELEAAAALAVDDVAAPEPTLAAVIQMPPAERTASEPDPVPETERPTTSTLVLERPPAAVPPARSGRGAKRAAVLAIALLVVAAVGLTVLLGHKTAPKTTPAAASSTPTVAASSTPPSPAPTVAPRRVRALAMARPAAIRLLVTSSRLPVAATVTVDPAGRGHLVRTKVVLRRAGQVVVVDGLPAGKARWSIRVVDGKVAAFGTVMVPAPATQPTAPSPSATYAPSAAPTVAPTHATTHHHDTSSGGGPVGPGGGGPTGPVR